MEFAHGLYGFKYSCQIQKKLNGLKNSYLILISYTRLYGFKYFYLILIIYTQLYVFK